MRQVAVPAALVVAGAVALLVTGSSTLGVVLATLFMGTAAVIAISLVFYAVGRSEDRERAREAEERARRGRAR
jgi:hypothetical protein